MVGTGERGLSYLTIRRIWDKGQDGRCQAEADNAARVVPGACRTLPAPNLYRPDEAVAAIGRAIRSATGPGPFGLDR